MSYRVIVDSCGELTPQMKESGIFKTASLSMEFWIPLTFFRSSVR